MTAQPAPDIYQFFAPFEIGAEAHRRNHHPKIQACRELYRFSCLNSRLPLPRRPEFCLDRQCEKIHPPKAVKRRWLSVCAGKTTIPV